ncbi:MAG: 3'-5' exonuclease [Verrucomicrobia bacterium]|nr:3'-5' exonuclease [Verrucomicrobiota bacterium]
MSPQDIELVAIDFETTGTVGNLPSEPWQIGMVRITEGRIDSTSVFESLLRVGDRPFNPNAPGIHHQLKDQLAAAPSLQELWPQLRGWWYGHPLVAHNISTEKTIITKAAPLHVPGPWIDTLKLARIAYPARKTHSLTDLLDDLELQERTVSLCPGRLPHDALFDAIGCAVLLEHLLSLEGWAAARIEDLASAHPQNFYRVRNRRGADA